VKGLVVVTRPSNPGERLQQRLRDQGWDAVWWPAFVLGAPADEAHARATLTRLADFDLAVFVSPAAVAAAAALLEEPWPTTAFVGAVGAATAEAVREHLRLADEVTVVTPPDDTVAGSEAFWSEWRRRGLTAKRVLVLRAQHGREWLSDRFSEAGASVETLPVYTRNEATLSAGDTALLQRMVAAHGVVISIFSSSEAIDALDHQVDRVMGAAAWLRQGIAIAIHPRIRERLLAAGYKRVELSASDDDALITRLESL
jgi:uroporphyrinogen-III synthase